MWDCPRCGVRVGELDSHRCNLIKTRFFLFGKDDVIIESHYEYSWWQKTIMSLVLGTKWIYEKSKDDK